MLRAMNVVSNWINMILLVSKKIYYVPDYCSAILVDLCLSVCICVNHFADDVIIGFILYVC